MELQFYLTPNRYSHMFMSSTKQGILESQISSNISRPEHQTNKHLFLFDRTKKRKLKPYLWWFSVEGMQQEGGEKAKKIT